MNNYKNNHNGTLPVNIQKKKKLILIAAWKTINVLATKKLKCPFKVFKLL